MLEEVRGPAGTTVIDRYAQVASAVLEVARKALCGGGQLGRLVDDDTTNSAVGPEDDVNRRVDFLPNKGPVFRRLINNRPCLDIVRFVLGREAILSEFSASITWSGNREIPLHIDQWFMPHPVEPDADYPRPSDITRSRRRRGDPAPDTGPVNPPVVCNVMFAITDFAVANGATRLVPGSHRSGCHPDPARRCPTVHAEVPAGSFVVWEGRTWHAASLNTGTGSRIGITTCWSACFPRQLLNFPYGLRPEVAADLTEHECGLMGGALTAPAMTSSPSGPGPAPTTQVRSPADQDMASAHGASRVCPRQPTPASGT